MEFLLAAINRVAFSIGSLTVEWYGLILTSAMVIGLIYIIREGKRIDLKPDDSLELFLWIIPLAVIFARLLYVLVRPDEYLPVKTWDDFVNFIAIWEGGITIIGGILGGVIGGIIFSLIRKRNFGKVADLIIPALLLGQAIGRWGNFINQEAFGVAISNPALQWFPFAVYIDSPFAGVAEGWYAATFFYEMLWNLIGCFIFYAVWRKNKKAPGILGFFYAAWYFTARGFLEMIRLDAVITDGGVRLTLVASFVLAPLAAIAAVIYYVWCKKREAQKPDEKDYSGLGGLVVPEVDIEKLAHDSDAKNLMP
ncbi:MAG TPA: prolipoprotein diacylglyceryl transferase [Clostridia bacterium]|nr:prolipoprotein diacylglyceryl transferase [Clostridia bacterium]HRU85009.1 prolipoprotein diacylglyceryl transferase [Eubacteriales bacterium]